MFNNKKLVLLAVTLIALTITLSAISATEDVDAADTQSLENTVTQGTTTSVTDKQIVNENNKIITKNNKNIDKKESSNIILNSTNFNDYVTDGKFNEKVSDGDTIDIQGKLDGSRFALNITKPVNIISSTNDSYLAFKDNKGSGSFVISKEGSGTNLTNINFYNTHISIENTSNINIDNISLINEHESIGWGVGAISIREGSENITIKNSYFKSWDNGGHSNVVFAAAYNCLFENNIIEGYRSENPQSIEGLGNLLYLTTYNLEYATLRTNINITIRNNTIRSFNVPSGMATCYGLCLEGTGHVIENNYIDTNYPVMAQYADSSYGMETNIDEITFRNNVIVRGNPQLVFPGTVSDNIFADKATLKQVKAYNNTFNEATIQNNVRFENNTANKVIILGNNNSINNNEVCSDDDYAITINGENNTITNNVLASAMGVGDNAIINSTEFISLNNIGPDSSARVIVINDENYEDYFDDNGKIDIFLKDTYKEGDILVLNTTKLNKKLINDDDVDSSVTEIIITNSTADVGFVMGLDLKIINSTIPSSIYKFGTVYVTLINSIFGGYSGSPRNLHFDLINSTLLTEYPKDNTYLWSSNININQEYESIFNKTGYLIKEIKANDKIILINYIEYFETLDYYNNVYIDHPVNIGVLEGFGTTTTNVHFVEGSETSNVTGVNFMGNVLFETENINFFNCTFNNDLVINHSNNYFENCTFNGIVTLNSSNINIFNNNIFESTDSIALVNSRSNVFENNTLNITGEYAIVFDDDSNNNIVRYNSLFASSSFGDYSVIGGYNTVEYNTPTYDVDIVVDFDSLCLIEENPKITITVTDIDNNMLVTKGYVEVYYDGIFVDRKDLVNGQVSIVINPILGINPLKVWYYDGIRYANNVSSINVEVVKSNVTIDVNEFTAKMNEEATITATFLNQKGNPVQATNVTFTVGRLTYTVETVDGVASFSELVTGEWLDAGKITVTFPDTDAYNRNTSTINLNTSKADIIVTPTVTVEGSTANINLALTDELNNNITDGKVTITTMDGTQLASGRVNNGVYTATVTIPEGYTSEYLVANYTGSYYYNDMARNIKLSLMLNSTITIQTNSPVYGEELVINGKLEDSKGNAIGNTNVTLSLNGTKAVVTTDSNGDYTYTYIPELGVNTITATFNGNEDVYGCSVTKNITIRDTTHEINDLLNQIEELTAENEALTDELANASNVIAEQNATINDLNNTVQQQSAVIEELEEVIEELTAKKSTRITLDNITDAKYGDTITISGKLVDEKGYGVPGTIKLLINNGRATVKTNANGVFSYDYKVTQVATYNVQASFLETDAYNPCNATMSFDVAQQDTIIIFDEVTEVKVGNNVTVTGKLVDANGNAIVGNIKLLINSGRATVKTDSNGVFTYTFTAGKIGTNNITATYLGNTKYLETSAATTVEVTAKDTQIVFDDIAGVKKGEKVTISGKLVDEDGNAIVGTIKLLINGGRATVKTDANGVFTYEYTANKVGTLDIQANYLGATRYTACNATTTAEVAKLGTKITFNGIGTVTQKTTATISGKLADENGNAITGTVKLLINNGRATVKTDDEGLFTYSYNATRTGVNTVTATYLESANYLAAEASTSFTVVKP